MMAEPQHKGLMQLLTSRDIPWTKRVKIIRYAWAYDSVVIPNKKPFLLNFIITGLVNRRKDLSVEENNALWRCSRDVLQAACQQATTNTASDVYSLKNGFVQLVLAELNQLASSSPVDVDHCAIIVSCCHALTTSTILGLDLTSKFENMLKLLTSVLQLLLKSVDEVTNSLNELLNSLLVVSVPHYATCLRQKSSSQQIAISICSKIFVLYIRFTSLVNNCAVPSSSLRTCLQELKSCMVTALFPKELLMHYSAFLQRKIDKVGTGWKEARFISVLFDAMMSGFKDDETRPAIVQGIVWIYTKLTECYREKNSELPLLLLRYLAETFCFDANIHTIITANVDAAAATDSKVDDGSVEKRNFSGTELLNDRVHVLHLLFETTIASNVYDAVYDMSHDNKTLHWFQEVTTWLLQQKSWCTEWFFCIRHLLLLSSATVESRLVAIINIIWTIDPSMLPTEARQAQDALLFEIVRTCARMRQVNRLMRAMLLAIRLAKGRVFITGTFVDSLQSCFADLDPMSVVDIWTEINKELSSEYVDSSTNNLSAVKIEAICELITLFVMNVTACGHSITQMIESKLSVQLQSTCQYVLSQLYNICLVRKSEEGASGLMKLLHACGEMKLLRRAYGYTEENQESAALDRNFSDLSLLYSDWKCKRWLKFHCFITTSGNMPLLLCWESLVIQGLQYDRCCNRILTETFLQQLNDFVLLGDQWNISKMDASQQSACSSHWSTVLNNVPLLIPSTVVSNVHVEAISNFLQNSLTLSSCGELHVVAQKFVSQSTFLEMRPLHTCLLISVIEGILACLASTSSRKFKRRKSSNEQESLVNVSKLLGDLNKDVASDDIQISPKLVSSLNELFENTNITESLSLSENAPKQLIALLNTLNMLPVEFLDVADQVKCILSMFVLAAAAACASDDLNNSDCQTVLTGTLKTLQCLLFDVRGVHALMNALGTSNSSLLQWYVGLHWQITIQNAENMDLLRISDDILKRLIRLSTKHSTMILHLSDLVVKMKKKCHDNSNSQNDQRVMKFTFHTLSTVLEVITKVLRRPYLRPENRAAFCVINDSITQELSKGLIGPTDGLPVSRDSNDDAESSWILLSYACQLEYVLLQHDKASDEENDKIRNKILNVLPLMCSKCLSHVQQTQIFLTITSCLRFVVVVCSCYDLLKDNLPDSFLCDVWVVMLNRLRTIDLLSEKPVRNELKQLQVGNEESTYLETTLAAVIKVCGCEDLKQHLEELLTDMESMEAIRVFSAMQVFCKITSTIEFYPKDVIKTILPYCRKVLLILQRIMMVETTDHFVITAALQLKTAMLNASWVDEDHAKSVVTSNMLSLCLHPCPAVEFLSRSSDVDSFVAVCHAWHGALNALLIFHSTIVYRMIPAYVDGVRQLLRAIMQAGTQRTDQRYTDQQLDQIVDCVRLFDRLASLICSHKINFAKAAPYLIADYVHMAHRVTLYPVVKRSLLLAIYKLFDICNEHTVRQLNAVLPAGAREVFRIVYANFDKYYRYSRRAATEDQRNEEFIRMIYNS